MAFNGSGTFNRLYDWTTDRDNSIKILASRVDDEDDGFATGLSTCITKDGQTTTTALIPFAVGLSTDTISEVTGAAGVTVDETLIKDGGAVLRDSTTTFVDDVDATKALAFQCSGITTATTRTVTWPDADLAIPAIVGDVVGPASATADSLARYDGTTGKLLKDGAVIGTDVQAFQAAQSQATWEAGVGTTESVVSPAKVKAAIDALASSGLPTGFVNGLITSNDAGDTAKDINITAGSCRDSTDAEDIVLATEITKQIDAAWAVGDDAGGMDTGAAAADTWYYVWLIKRTDTGVVDALFSLSSTAPTMPANYDAKRLIGFVLTDATPDIIAFNQYANNPGYFEWAVLRGLSTTTTTAGQLLTIDVPTGFNCEISWAAKAQMIGGGGQTVFSSPDAANAAVTALASATATDPLGIGFTDVTNDSIGWGPSGVVTNTSSQIRERSSTNGAALVFRVLSFKIDRETL
jgi:hypothetical protein